MAIDLQKYLVQPDRSASPLGQAGAAARTFAIQSDTTFQSYVIGRDIIRTGAQIGQGIVRRKQQRFMDAFNEGMENNILGPLRARPELMEEYMDSMDENGNMVRSQKFDDEITALIDSSMDEMGLFGQRRMREWAERTALEYRQKINEAAYGRIRAENLAGADEQITKIINENMNAPIYTSAGVMDLDAMTTRVEEVAEGIDTTVQELYEEGAFATQLQADQYAQAKKGQAYERTAEAIARTEGLDAADVYLDSVPVEDLPIQMRETAKKAIADSMDELEIRAKQEMAERRVNTMSELQVDILNGEYVGKSRQFRDMMDPEVSPDAYPELNNSDRYFLMNLNESINNSLKGGVSPEGLKDMEQLGKEMAYLLMNRVETPEEMLDALNELTRWSGENYVAYLSGEEYEGYILAPTDFSSIMQDADKINPAFRDRQADYLDNKLLQAFGSRNHPGYAREFEAYLQFNSGEGGRFGAFINPNGRSEEDKIRWINNRYDEAAIEEARDRLNNTLDATRRMSTYEASPYREGAAHRGDRSVAMLREIEAGNLFGVLDTDFLEARLRPGAQPLSKEEEQAAYLRQGKVDRGDDVDQARSEVNADYLEYVRANQSLFWRETGLRPDDTLVDEDGSVVLAKDGYFFKLGLAPGTNVDYWTVRSEREVPGPGGKPTIEYSWIRVGAEDIEELLTRSGGRVGE